MVLRRIPRWVWLAVPFVYAIYFYGLSITGVLGPDEPRYAAVAREMARSGDWITPRLWGTPWFEKPALLYWMTGAGFRLGIAPELALRLPGAILAVGFLAFYRWALCREFGGRVASMATMILGSGGMWIAYSQAAVTDLPLTATFSAGMLLALPWVARRERAQLSASAALFGLAVLAKGLVPFPLLAPLAIGRTVWDWLKPRVALAFAAVAVPWYALCYWRNGWKFIHDFFVVHHFSRVTSGTLMHGQPWWFYLPVVAAGLLPWTPLIALLRVHPFTSDRRRAFLGLWALVVMLLFSVSVNKLPGYILPMMPPLAALLALSLEEAPEGSGTRMLLAACACLLVAFPITGKVLPNALLVGLTRAPRPAFEWVWLAPLALAAAAWVMEARGRRVAAVAIVAVGAALGTGYLKVHAAPELDRIASARRVWRQIEDRANDVCLGDVKRDWEYGLNYYAGRALPHCGDSPRKWAVAAAEGGSARVVEYVPPDPEP
jgi:4-amino-4-deoxy-L-arabinose transferase-like glycosyltransferase